MNPLSLSARSTPTGLLVGLLLGFGCSSSDAPSPANAPGVDGGGASGDATTTTPPTTDGSVAVDSGCPRTPNTSDRVRSIVVSQPFDANGGKASSYELLALGVDGNITRGSGQGGGKAGY